MVSLPAGLLGFSITPCQGFITAARTVRDLKVGSALLSHLVGEAILAGVSKGGKLVFPVVDVNDIRVAKNDSGLHIPNQFVMEFGSEGDASEGAKAAEEAVRGEWRRIAEEVKTQLAHKWQSKSPDWDTDWEKQIESLWEIRTIVYAPSDNDAEVYDRLYAEPAHSDWQRQWRLLAAAQRTVKQVRHFPGDQGIGRPKCSMMGELEQMGPGGSLEQQRKFWQSISGVFSWYGIRIGERDRLCAVSLVKRFAPCVVMQGLKKRILDTAAIAAAKWLASAEEQDATKKRLAEWQDAADGLAKVLKEEAETQGRYLLTDERRPEAFVPRGWPENEKPGVVKAAEKMLDARRRLLVAARDAGLGAPPRYLAVLCLDGDYIGKWLSGEFWGEDSFGPDDCRGISRKLREYAGQVPSIVKAHQGYCVYAGGDDVLALLPVDTAMECAQRLRCQYPQLGKNGVEAPETTASAGVAWGHYMQDLRDLLTQAREAAREAKEWGRDALGWRVLRRSGAITQGVIPWAAVPHIIGFTDLLQKFSDRWVYRLAEAYGLAFQESDEDEPAQALIGYFAGRVEGDKSKTLAAEAVCLYKRLRKFVDYAGGRHPEPPDGYRTAGSVLKRLIDNLILSSFIARRGG